MNKITKVFIDSSTGVYYSSYYIKGLYDLFGRKNVAFSKKYFGQLKRRSESHSYDHYMAFVVCYPDKSLRKIVIDFRDKPSIKESAYEWSNQYAKINFNKILTEKRFHEKIISIPPGFGIHIWNFWETAYYCLGNLILCRFKPLVSLKDHLKDYYRQFRRGDLNSYLFKEVKRDTGDQRPYVFLASTLWTHQNCMEGTNIYRKKFIEICKGSNCNFEGGFIASLSHPQYQEFKDLVSKRYDAESYILKTKLSTIVFNTIAVHNCHGWKLGEFLAMGKAILSTPILNALPGELKHGESIHILSSLDELPASLEILINDRNYRQRLETGAKNYYQKYGTPKKVIETILGNQTVN